MHSGFLRKSIYLFVALALIIQLKSSPAFCATVSMEYQLGFNGVFQLKKWTPITITLENRGHDIHGTLEIIVTSGSEFWRDVQATTYSLSVELPSNSKKLCSFTVLINTFAHPLVIRLRQDETVLISETLNLRNYFTEKSLVLILGERISPEFLALIPTQFQTVATRPEFLPEVWYGYDGAGLIILPAGILNALREKQFNALQEWIEHGGYLVTAGDLHYGVFNEDNTRQLLGARITGFEKLSALPGLKSFCGQGLTSRDPFLILKTDMPGAASLLTEKGLPLILQKEIGLGRIIFLAFDYENPPFISWPGKELFWQKIISLKPLPDLQPLELDQQLLQNSMIAAMSLHFPSVWVTLLLLSVYFGLLKIILWQAQKEKIRPAASFICSLALSILLVGGTWASYYHKSSQQEISVNHFWLLKKNGNQTFAFCRSLTGLYAVKDSPYQFSYGLPEHPLIPILPAKLGEKVLNSVSLDRNKKEQIITVNLDRWSYRFLVMNTVVPFALSSKAAMQGHDLVLEFSNQSSYTIKNGCLYFKERLFLLDDLPPGQTLTRRFPEKELSEQERFSDILAERTTRDLTGQASGRYARLMENAIINEALLGINKLVAKQNNVLYFCGWIEDNFWPLTFEKPVVNGEGITFIEWTLPVQGAEE
jgi:hypothetical protein